MKKKILLLIIISILTCALFVNASAAASVSAQATESSLKDYEQKYAMSIEEIPAYGTNPYNIDVDALAKLTDEDVNNIYNNMCANAEQKAIAINSKANNDYVAKLIKQISSNKTNTVSIQATYADINNVEIALGLLYPADFIAYCSISQGAIDIALQRYTDASCWWSGNGDAFRHVSWSARLYTYFYDGNNHSKTTARSRTFTWLYAHEGYAPNQTYPSAYNTSLPIDVQMDLRNNIVGMNMAETRINNNNYAPATLLTSTQSIIDNGQAVRVQNLQGVNVLVLTDRTEKR